MVSLSQYIDDAVRQALEESQDLPDRQKYVLFSPDEINGLRAGRTPEAHDSHLYLVHQTAGQPQIEESCCGHFAVPRSRPAQEKIWESPTARTEAAALGRQVCGRCVAALYGNKDMR